MSISEVLLALAGFAGGLIEIDLTTTRGLKHSRKANSFRVKAGGNYPVDDIERQQINKIVPLGWYYLRLNEFVDRNDLIYLMSARGGGGGGGGGGMDSESYGDNSINNQEGDPDKRHGKRWEQLSSTSVYKKAIAACIKDVLDEYTGDIVYIEQQILESGPVPYSHLTHHFQKYLLVFPTLFEILEEIEDKRLHGCQLLDYFYRYLTGIAALNQIIQKILFRLRVVFLKQIFGWMIYGDLDDPGNEFFIQSTSSKLHIDNRSGGYGGVGNGYMAMAAPSIEERVLTRLERAAQSGHRNSGLLYSHQFDSAAHSEATNFDWTISYTLSLEQLPESHITPRMATKIVFAGKAVKLLQSSGDMSATWSSMGFTSSDVYRYLSAGGNSSNNSAAPVESGKDSESVSSSTWKDRGASGIGEGWISSLDDVLAGILDAQAQGGGPTSSENDVEQIVFDSLSQHVNSCGYSVDEVNRFSAAFRDILQYPRQAIESLEAAVDDINTAISSRLWKLLKNKLGFVTFLHLIRNTYLLGKGELYQSILDGINGLTCVAIPDSAEMDKLINWNVIRASGKLLGLDDDALISAVKIRVNNSTVILKSFSTQQSGEITLSGDAVLVPSSTSTSTSVKFNDSKLSTAPVTGAKISLCSRKEVRSDDTFLTLWSKYLSRPIVDQSPPADVPEIEKNQDSSGRNGDRLSLYYSVGAVWLTDQKYVTKGFQFSCSFLCDWVSIHGKVASFLSTTTSSKSSASMNRSVDLTVNDDDDYNESTKKKSVVIGNVGLSMHSDRRGAQVPLSSNPSADPLSAITDAVFVGVVFVAESDVDSSDIRYYAVVTVRKSKSSTISGSFNLNKSHSQMAYSGRTRPASSRGDEKSSVFPESEVLAEDVFEIDDSKYSELLKKKPTDFAARKLRSSCVLYLEVDYSRHLISMDPPDSSASNAAPTTTSSVGYKLKARLRESSTMDRNPLNMSSTNLRREPFTSATARKVSQSTSASSLASSRIGGVDDDVWDVEVAADISNLVRCQGGNCFVGVIGAGIVLSPHTSTSTLSSSSQGAELGTAGARANRCSDAFHVDMFSLSFLGRGAMSNYPVASPYTTTRFPDTFLRIEAEVSQFRAWMNLKLLVQLPPMFKVIFDPETIVSYERIFSVIMKVRLVANSLEKLWIARSRLIMDRMFCIIRHSMHFFISNLLYYLQVDVIDSEYALLQKSMNSSDDFQSVLKAHKNFIANIMRLSLMDNSSIQEGMERVLQVCLRFVAVCRILHQAEESETITSNSSSSSQRQQHPPIYIPPEEFTAIRKDFYSHVTFLFKIMRKVESRGFMFRLDFNGFISKVSMEMNLNPSEK